MLHGACTANLHALLAIEWEIPGGPGERAHFLAVATYGIQHPGSMGYTVETVDGLRAAVRDVLTGAATIADIRTRVRRDARATGRVTRRDTDEVPSHVGITWDMRVTDVVNGGVTGYADRVERWAHSTLDTLERTS